MITLLGGGLREATPPSLVPAGGAMRIDGTVYYVLKDRLGSAYATTDVLGNVVGEMRYYAFGETRLSTGTMFTDRLFTGQRQIAELGVYHFNARFYSPKLGRFLSADSIMSGFANPQGLNRFAYVANNPLRYTDPTGHMICAFCDGGGDFPDSTPPTDEPESPVTDPKTDPETSVDPKTDPETPPSSTQDSSSEPLCPECGFEVFEGILHFLEGAVFAGVSIYALGAVLAVGPEGLIAAPIFVATALIGINFAWFGVQEIQYGLSNGTAPEPDPIPLIHLVDPNFGK